MLKDLKEMDMKNKPRLNQILAEYTARLKEALGDELESVILYGSRAREDAGEGSDIDVLCVIKSPQDYAYLIRRTSAATAEISLKYGVVLSRVFTTHNEFNSSNTPFLMNVHREGIPL